MVFYINKQAIEIKSRFHGITLTSVNECVVRLESWLKCMDIQCHRSMKT